MDNMKLRLIVFELQETQTDPNIHYQTKYYHPIVQTRGEKTKKILKFSFENESENGKVLKIYPLFIIIKQNLFKFYNLKS